MSRPLCLLLAAVALVWGAAFGCSATSGTGSAGAGATASSASVASASGGFTTSSAADGVTSSVGTGGGCAGTATKAQPIPLDIFVMLDQSGSMLEDAGNGMTKWQTVKSALTTFMQEPSTAGIGMGIQYFGLPQPAVPGCTAQSCTSDTDCTGGCTLCLPQGVCQSGWNPDIDSCDAVDYAWADVPIQPLPGVTSAILTSLGMHPPGTNTPTSPALQGAVDYAKAWETKHPSHVTVVAFATDGQPSECDIDINNIDAIAATAFAGTPSVKTFVVGVGGALQILDGIAAAGGTTSAFHVDMNPAATQELVDALNTIRGAALGCTYQIPPPPPGMQEDFGLVNVSYQPGDMSPAHVFPRVGGPGQCPSSGEAWYYDSNTAPTRIILCDAACHEVAADQEAEIDIVLGCATIAK
jgi:hypothetical protein